MTESAFRTFLSWANLSFVPHQLEGVEWCLNKERADTIKKGGIIADEMGLGKTILMLATMSINMVSRTLIVLPQCLLQQWHAEILRTTGHNALIYHKTNKFTLSELDDAFIVLSTYGTISYTKKPCPLFDIEWDRIICDEAHHIRNPKTNRYGCCKALRSPIWWLMTGTPIHNTSKDIKSLLKLLDVSDISDNILRRTKADVGIKMPPIVKTQIFVEWKHEEEREMAKDIHSSLSMLHFPDPSIGWSKIYGKGAVLVSMLRGRQTCNLPRLLEKTIQNDKLKCDLENIDPPPFSMYEYAIQNGHSKMDAITNHLIERKHNGNGKIVFCHFTKEIEMLTIALRENGAEWVGGWSDFKAIQSKTPILILQIQTGCEGLNLQQFSEVYFICPHWNPAIEDQAIARCHRIGQKKKVEIFEFVMNSLKPAEVNEQADIDVRKFEYVFKRIAWDIKQQILSYILPTEYIALPEHMKKRTYTVLNRTLNSITPDQFSLDKYVLYKQNKKREKTDHFYIKNNISI